MTSTDIPERIKSLREDLHTFNSSVRVARMIAAMTRIAEDLPELLAAIEFDAKRWPDATPILQRLYDAEHESERYKREEILRTRQIENLAAERDRYLLQMKDLERERDELLRTSQERIVAAANALVAGKVCEFASIFEEVAAMLRADVATANPGSEPSTAEPAILTDCDPGDES